MNRVMLVGRITAKPELRYTSSNLAFTRFSLAVNRTYSNTQGERQTDFINIVVWRKQAENVCNYLNKGSLVSIEGRLQTGNYTDKDGNKRYTVEVLADSVQFLESKNQSRTRENDFDYEPVAPMEENAEISVDNDPFADFGDSVSIDDDFLD